MPPLWQLEVASIFLSTTRGWVSPPSGTFSLRGMRRAVLDTQRSGLGPDLLDIRHHDCGGDNRVVDTEL